MLRNLDKHGFKNLLFELLKSGLDVDNLVCIVFAAVLGLLLSEIEHGVLFGSGVEEVLEHPDVIEIVVIRGVFVDERGELIGHFQPFLVLLISQNFWQILRFIPIDQERLKNLI